ncbi:hypothetical protein D915_002742 [Fasciola hepatica]|uniref:SURP motif domain-containing protein n=1 Tax=Fasciola hepatica TaxID=6192 RepID=A0A4E0RGW2_FASHE|nr:hypothetical protein D915_002742 [Fasciola hepatica]
MSAVGSQEELVVVGRTCVLLDNPEKSLDTGDGHLLVPWGGDNSLLIDRYDCRAHLTDLNGFESSVTLGPGDYLSEEELTVEKMCEFERYLELRVDVDEMVTQTEEEKKRESERARSQYGAVGFSYDEGSGINEVTQKGEAAGETDHEPLSPEAPYVCPQELVLSEGVDLPETEKQAQIIERTAVFVARQGNQMEIILKAKQTNNPLFSFLNYDHRLNQFYKEVVKLIKSGRYIPKARPAKVESEMETKYEPNKSIHEDVYELKLPKVDISNTAYASLINKFKKVNEAAAANQICRDLPAPDSGPCQTQKPSDNSPPQSQDSSPAIEVESHDIDSSHVQVSISKPPVMNVQATSEVVKDSPDATSSTSDALAEEYEQCYQEYYKHYYAHYYAQFSEQQSKLLGQSYAFSDEQRSAIVQQAAKAAAVAASAAVNAMYQAGIKRKLQETMVTPTMTASERGIIDKMAEYVTRNGPEFEELVTRQKGNDPRFGFLKPTHPLHSYYQSRKQTTTQDEPEHEEKVLKTDDIASCSETDHVDIHQNGRLLPESHSPDRDFPKERQASISFRLSRPNGGVKIRTTTPERTATQTCVTTTAQLPDVHVTASCPVLYKQSRYSQSPQTPPNSLMSTEDALNGRSPSPVKFSLPGIPFASDTSSTESSPRADTRSVDSSPRRSPSRSPVTCSPPHEKVVALASPDAASLRSSLKSEAVFETPTDTVKSYSDHRQSPIKIGRSVTLSPVSKLAGRASPQDSWESSAVEEMLGLVDGSLSKEKSPDPSSLHHAAQKVLDERIKEERRKRAAQLVARLKSSTASESRTSSSLLHGRQTTTPPPPPDSVPAAVAHAVVASLKRRQEESRASAEAEAKARKRARSPPAAYALPKERSHKSSKHSRRSRRSPSPDNFIRARDLSRERSYPKHPKYKKSRH